MTVIWAERAEQALHSVEEYIKRDFGEQARLKFMQKAEATAGQLASFPHYGKIEPLLAHRQKSYRSVVVTKQSKLIYYVESERIVIADFWECRREPESLAQGL